MRILCGLVLGAISALVVGGAQAADPKAKPGKTLSPGGTVTQPGLLKQTAPTVAAPAPDLKPSITGPAEAKPGKKLGKTSVTVRNGGPGEADAYTVELFLKKGSRETPLREDSGRRMSPNGSKQHEFTGILLSQDLAVAQYQLCARVGGGGEAAAQARNNESCQRIGIGTTTLSTKGLSSGAPAPQLQPSGPRASGAAQSVKPGTGLTAGDPTRALGSRGLVTGAVTPSMDSEMRRRLDAYEALKGQRADYERVAREQAAEAAARRARVFSGDDCDDSNRHVYPGATETCDGLDNDCNGRVDEGVTLTAYVDADGDAHGNPRTQLLACPGDLGRAREDGSWLVLVGNDCDDSNPELWRECP